MLELVGCENIEATVGGRRVLKAGTGMRSGAKRLYRQVMLGGLERSLPKEEGAERVVPGGRRNNEPRALTLISKEFEIIDD